MFSPKNYWWIGILVTFFLTVILYWQFYLLGKIPMPADTVIGAYFPWLDYKWGFAVGVPVKNALISDVFSQFFVWKYLIVDIFKMGQIPLWNIYSLSGTPLLATFHSAVFNPFNIFLFLPGSYGWGLFISAQTFSAILGMFLLLGFHVKNLWARIFGSIVFSLSGLMTTWTEFGTGVYAASMLPWIFLFLEKYFSTKKMRYLFLMSFSFVILFLSGHAQLTLYSTVLVTIFLGIKFLNEKNFKQILYPLIFVFLAGVFCSFQFLPTYEFTKESIRANEAYSSSFNYGLNPLYEVVKFFSADFFGNPTTNNYWDQQSYHEQSIFLGTIPFILILALITFEVRKKKLSFWTGVFLASIILGFENPLSKIIYSLPLPFITYSSAARIFFITSFSAGILAAKAFEKLSDGNFGYTFKRINLYILACLIGILLGLVFIIYIYGNYAKYPELLKDILNFKVTAKNLSLSIGIAFFALVIFIISNFKPKFKNIILIFFLAITFADLSRYFYKYNPFISQNLVFPKTPAIEFLQNQQGLFRIARLDKEVMPPNTWIYYKLQSVEGYDPLISENYARLFNLVKGENYWNTLSRYRELDNFRPEYLDALNVKYLLSVKRDEKNNVKGNLLNPKINENGYKVIFEDQNTVISENPNALPRAYFVSKLQSLDSKDTLVNTISSKSFDPGKEALILEQLNLSQVMGQGHVEILSYTPNRIEFITQTKNDEFLVFADSYNKGWKLQRNSNPEKIYEANLALRGIVVPSGKNTFVMEFFPDSLKIGLYLSAISVTAYFFILLYGLMRKKM